jgi:hypothetical protein
MARLYTHLFLGTVCEAPGCIADRCDIYLTNAGRNAVRACCAGHAEEAEKQIRRLEDTARTARRAA